MKKNLLTIIILALLIVNIVMTAIMMFTVIPANQKTMALVGQISGAIKLDTAGTAAGDGTAAESTAAVSLADSETYSIADQQTFQLKKGADGKDHYVVAKVAILMNKKDDGYATYGADIATKEPLILNALSETVGGYTYEDIEALGQTGLQDASLEKIQALFGSKFIYQVALSGYIVQ